MNEVSIDKQTPSIITVIGVGGAGGNALNHMWNIKIKDVNFLACNTDKRALGNLSIPDDNKIVLGDPNDPLYGLGAGNNPLKGRDMATASLDQIKQYLESKGTKMVFIAAGMVGGTGTGAAPVIAKLTHEMGLLTVANVTSPMHSEGPTRCDQAAEGIEELRKYADSLLVINNDSILQQYGKLPISKAFGKADDILASATKGIAEIITVTTAFIRVDFADLERVMRNSGRAHMGVAQAEGEGRAMEAARRSLCSPLLDSNLIAGAKKVLINIAAKDVDNITYEEGNEIVEYIQSYASFKDDNGVEHRADIIWGASTKDTLDDDVLEVVVVATGFEEQQIPVESQTFPGLGDNIEILPPPPPFEKKIDIIEPKQGPVVQHPRETPSSPITLERRPSKYLNLDAELKLPSFVRRNVKLETYSNTNGRKDVFCVDAHDESAASHDNRLTFNN